MALSEPGFLILIACIGCAPAADQKRPFTRVIAATPAPPAPSARDAPTTTVHAARAKPTPRTETSPNAASTDARGIAASLRDYPWHADASLTPLHAADTLARRFAPPDGFARVDTAVGSFGHWLRTLPLAAEGTAVRSYSGNELLPASHPHVAAVSTLDTGPADLQQCADAVMRLHAEWLWSSGRAVEASYASGGGPISWQRYLGGSTPTLAGNSFVWRDSKPRRNEHATYRRYLDVVFSWASTVSLARAARTVSREDLAAGDFFVLGGSPGHAVLVLDVAADPSGRRVALLGQSYMPAQSFQVLRPDADHTWFPLGDERGVKTPFWVRFPWASLRRLPG